MPLEEIPKSKWDPEIYTLAQAKKKGEKIAVDLNPITPEIKKQITEELTVFFESTIEQMKNISIEDIDFIFEESGKIKKAYVKFPEKLQKKYQILMEFFFAKTDISTLENYFKSGDHVKAERNKIARKLKTFQTKRKTIELALNKVKKNETEIKKLDYELQIVDETITALQDILKTEINNTLRYVIGSVVEKYTSRASSTTFSSISFDLEPIIDETSYYRTHFPQGIPNFLKGVGLGYKLYVALANSLGVMFSARNATTEAKAVWIKLLTELKGFYAFFIKETALRGVIKEDTIDRKLKSIVNVILKGSEELFESEKNYIDAAEVKIVTRILLTNRKFKSLVSDFLNSKSYKELLDKIETKRNKTKDLKLKAELTAMTTKIKKLKITDSLVEKFVFRFKLKDFIDELKDPAFKKRMEELYAKDLELLK